MYNTFLQIVNGLYPSTFYNSNILSTQNIQKVLKYNFINIKYKRYNYKKQVILCIGNQDTVSNTRYRSLIIWIILKVLNYVWVVV